MFESLQRKQQHSTAVAHPPPAGPSRHLTVVNEVLALSVDRVAANAFGGCAGEWDGLLAGDADMPFARHAWVRIWHECFAPTAEMCVLRAHTGTHTRAYAPFIKAHATLAGLSCPVWEFPANSHTPRVEWAVGHAPAAAIAALWRELRTTRGWDVLRWQNVRTDSVLVHTLLPQARADGFLTMQWDVFASPYIPLHAGLDPESLLSTKTRANLRRRRKKLVAQGKMGLRCVSEGADLERALKDAFRIEASGWKGEGGTAVQCDADTARFYRALAQHEAGRGGLALYFLDLDGEPIAFQYGLRYRDCYYLLKPGYLATHAQYSPGQLLMTEVLRDLAQKGVREFDFLGHDMPWKREWTVHTRPHSWLFVLRPTLKNRAICARYLYGPKAMTLVRASRAAWRRLWARPAVAVSRWFSRQRPEPARDCTQVGHKFGIGTRAFPAVTQAQQCRGMGRDEDSGPDRAAVKRTAQVAQTQRTRIEQTLRSADTECHRYLWLDRRDLRRKPRPARR